MQARDLRSRDLFGQVKRLVEGFEAERKARQAAEAANKAKSELLATISHELRTPMEAVVAMGELLLSTPLDETQQRHAETLLQSWRSLLNALNDVLDFPRLATGRFEADLVAFDLHALIHDVAAELQARANDKGLTGSLDIGTSCPRMSLLTPAAAPSADGADRQFAQIHLDRLGPPACERQRRGRPPGTQIRHRRQRRRFEQGRQGSPSSSLASRSTANLGEVTGLGLPIARKLAKLMSGDIGCRAWAASIGSRFRHSTRDLNQRSGQRPVGQPQANPQR